jgi:hypothetical protein
MHPAFSSPLRTIENERPVKDLISATEAVSNAIQR